MPDRVIQHNDRDDVERYIREACDIADALELRDADRATLLPKIVELVAAKTIMHEQPAIAGGLGHLFGGAGGR